MPSESAAVSSYHPDGSWSCTRDHRTTPCGDCDGCRLVQQENRTRAATSAALDAVVPPIPPPALPLVTKHTQTILADPELHGQGVYGNCLQAAIATLLNVHLDAVPHFAQFAWWEGAFTLWLRGHGLDATWVTKDNIPADGPTLLLGKSPRGWGHVCVGDGPEVIWDTHPSRDGLSSIEGAVLVHPWEHVDPRCFLCSRGPLRMEIAS